MTLCLTKTKTIAPAAKPKFEKHLAKMRMIHSQVDEVVSVLDQTAGLMGKASKATGELLFDHLCQRKQKEASLAEINTMAGAVYRIVQTVVKLGDFKHDQQAKSEMQAEAAGLPPELRAKLEQEFELI